MGQSTYPTVTFHHSLLEHSLKKALQLDLKIAEATRVISRAEIDGKRSRSFSVEGEKCEFGSKVPVRAPIQDISCGLWEIVPAW